MVALDRALRPRSAACCYHHERWDGGGYPTGCAGIQIPLEARILAVVDSYDAMTSDRPYRAALPAEQAVAEVERCAARSSTRRRAGVLEAWESGALGVARRRCALTGGCPVTRGN